MDLKIETISDYVEQKPTNLKTLGATTLIIRMNLTNCDKWARAVICIAAGRPTLLLKK